VGVDKRCTNTVGVKKYVLDKHKIEGTAWYIAGYRGYIDVLYKVWYWAKCINSGVANNIFLDKDVMERTV
jgi:hypothetical protein